MKEINKYIIEKLHIGKGMKTGVSYKEGDKFCIIYLEWNMFGDHQLLQLYPVFTVKKFTENKFTYIDDTNHVLSSNININGNGFAEHKGEDGHGAAIYLPISYAHDFTLNIVKDYKDTEEDKKKLLQYFDKSDEKLIFDENYIIYYLDRMNYDSYIKMIENNL